MNSQHFRLSVESLEERTTPATSADLLASAHQTFATAVFLQEFSHQPMLLANPALRSLVQTYFTGVYQQATQTIALLNEFPSALTPAQASGVIALAAADASVAQSVGGMLGFQVVPASSPASPIVVGPADPAHSTIAIAPASVQTGGTSNVTLTAKDAKGHKETKGGLTVVFGLGIGTGQGTFGTVTDHHNGTYSATFTGTTAGTNTITATIGGKAVTTTAPTVTIVGTADVSKSTVSVALASIPSTGTTTVKLIAKDANGNQETKGGLTVAFGLGSGTAQGTFSTVTDVGNGTYTATFTGTTAGSNTMTATIGGQAVTTTAPTIVVVGAADPTHSTIAVSPASIQTLGAATVTLIAKDANGNPETKGGATIHFSLGSGTAQGTFGTVTDHGDGTYTATFKGNTTGSNTISATIGGQAVTTTAPTIVVVGAADLSHSSVTVSPVSIPSAATATVTLTTRDANGVQETKGGLKVIFGLGSGTAKGTFGTGTDHGDGTYTATFTGTTAGSNTVTATIGGQAVTASAPTITVTTGAMAASLAQSTIHLAPASIQSGETSTVKLIVNDANGVQETTGGLTVVFGLGAGTGKATIGPVTDLADGTYTATLTGTTAGTNTVTATIGGQAVTSTAPTLVVVGPPNLALSTVSISPASIASGSTATITLTAKESNGNPATTGGSTVVFGLGSGTAQGTFGAVTDNGNGTYTATFTGSSAGTNTITATIGGQAVTSTAPTITISSVAIRPASPARSTVAANPASISLSSTATVTLTATDANGTPMATGGAAVTFGLGTGTAQGTFSSVRDTGHGTYIAIFTGTTVGTNTITATLNGQEVTSTAPTITVTAASTGPGPASPAQSTVVVTPASIASASTATVTLTAKDANGNAETTGGATVAFGLGLGTANGTFSIVTDNGDGTYTATFTGTGAGTNSITATINGLTVTSSAPTITVTGSTAGSASPAKSTVSTDVMALQTGDTANVTLTAVDANGNQLTTGGSTVVFQVGNGTAQGTFDPVTDNGDGTYSTTFTSTTVGTNTITASIDGAALTSTPAKIAVTSGPPPADPAQSTIALDTTSIQLGDTVGATVTAIDANGNQLTDGGSTVFFKLGIGTAKGTFDTVTDNGDGTYSTTFTSTTAGTNTITASIDGQAITSLAATVIVVGAASPAQSVVTLAAPSIANGSTTTVTLTANDTNGIQETIGGSTVTFKLGGGTAQGTFSTVTDNGDGTYTATFTATKSGTNTITATIDGHSVTSTSPSLSVL